MLLPPLPAQQWDEHVEHALRGMLPRARRNPVGAGNGLATLVRHPDLTKAFLALNVHLLFSSTLPARLRELAILRVAHLSDSDYEWEHHATLGAMVGLTADEVAGIRSGDVSDPFDRTVITAVDELDEKSAISEQTWTALGEQLDDRQRMDLIFTVGTYRLLAMAFNTFGVELEHVNEQER